MQTNKAHDLIFEFIEKYESSGFESINNNDSFVADLNKVLDRHHQFFFIGDLIKYRILYTSPQIKDLHGVSPTAFDPGYLITKVHHDDAIRLSRGRIKQMETAQKLYINKCGSVVLSSNFRIKNINGKYIHILVQCYIFYRPAPFDTVYILHLETPIEKFTELRNGRFHWYLGENKSYFRFPDKELLHVGSLFSKRELEIMTHIYEGLETKEISDRLFLSTHTISTHRRNILRKTGKSTVFEVIYELKNVGII